MPAGEMSQSPQKKANETLKSVKGQFMKMPLLPPGFINPQMLTLNSLSWGAKDNLNFYSNSNHSVNQGPRNENPDC